MDLNNEEEMNLLEKCIVTEEFCNRKDTYNIMEGGSGGWGYLNSKNGPYVAGSEKRHDAMKKANKNRDLIKQANTCKNTYKQKKSNKIEFQIFCQKVSMGVKQYKQNNPDWQVGKNNPMYGKVHTLESRQKMSKHAIENNPMYGKIWICNFDLEESKVWNESDPIPEGWIKGRHSKDSFKKIKEKQKLIEQKIKEEKSKKTDGKVISICDDLKLYREMFEEFKINEFEGVVKKFNYTKTRNNLLILFKKYFSDYKPKVCNRWKNRKTS
jgi:hypothetical protein